jgi:hypothetical protein
VEFLGAAAAQGRGRRRLFGLKRCLQTAKRAKRAKNRQGVLLN